MSVLVATAYMDEAERFDWLVAMNAGKVLATGTPAEVSEQHRRGHAREGLHQAAAGGGAKRGHREPVITPLQPTGGPPAIEAHGLTQRFGDFTAVDHVNFRIERGEIFGFLGSNGCGKTTTMKMLTGLLPPTEGDGAAVRQGDEGRRHRSPAGASASCRQAFSLYTELTVRQNLMLHAQLFDLPEARARRASRSCSTTSAWQTVADTLAESLPLGIRQRLSLAVAVLHEPEVLILDEPTSGVDPVARDGFWELLIRAVARRRA